MSRLYRQAYLYILLILILSLILTGISMTLFFDHREQGMVVHTFRRQVFFIRREVQHLQRSGTPAIRLRLEELSQQLGWEIVFWQQGRVVYSSLPPPLTPSLKDLDLRELRLQPHAVSPNPLRPTQLVMALYSRHPERGLIWMQLKLSDLRAPLRGPALFMLLILGFLAILLIPLTRFLLRPYRDLQASIQRLAEGDFAHPLDERRYPAFEELTQSFNRMRGRLQQMMEQKQRLVADVSHELRSPLTRLRVILELWHQRHPSTEDLLHRASGEIEELNRIIDDLLEISRLQLHHMPLKVETVDLTWLLYEAAEKHQELLDRKELELLVSMPEHAVRLQADGRLLRRVFNNLFSNLVKYVPGPGQVNLELQLREEDLLVRLRDRGPGIPPEDLEGIFTPFYRSDQSRSRRTGGAGLGLAIVWEIIQAHGGRIKAVLPQDGEGGLQMDVYLPLQQPENT